MSPKSMIPEMQPGRRRRAARCPVRSRRGRPGLRSRGQARGDAFARSGRARRVDDGAMPRIGDRAATSGRSLSGVLGVHSSSRPARGWKKPRRRDAEAGRASRRRRAAARSSRSRPARGGAAGHSLEQPHEVAALRAVGGRPVGGRVGLVGQAQRELRPGDRQVGIERDDVQRSPRVSRSSTAASSPQIRDLDHAARAAVVDHERLVALAAQIARLAADAVQLGARAIADTSAGVNRGGRRLEDAGGAGCPARSCCRQPTVHRSRCNARAMRAARNPLSMAPSMKPFHPLATSDPANTTPSLRALELAQRAGQLARPVHRPGAPRELVRNPVVSVRGDDVRVRVEAGATAASTAASSPGSSSALSGPKPTSSVSPSAPFIRLHVVDRRPRVADRRAPSSPGRAPRS